MDANGSYDPDQPGELYPLLYTPGVPTLGKAHNGKLSTLVQSCGLIDPLAHHHSTRPFPASHVRGSKCIDFILVSQGIYHTILHFGSLPFYSLTHGDHLPYFLDLDAHLLFADKGHGVAPAHHRQLRLHDPCIITKYTDALHNQLAYHKVFDKL
jgi:hypothetical protein